MNINLMAPINTLSYGVVSTNILRNLVSLGHEVALFPIGTIQCGQEFVPIIQQCIDNAGLFDPNAPSLRIFHQFSMAESIGFNQRIGFPIFELNSFNEVEKRHLNSLHKVIVCSEWAREIVIKNTWLHKKCHVFVAPLGVDTLIFHPQEINKKERTTNFITIGKWETRKGHDVLLEAFNKAFSPADDVFLNCATDNPFPQAKSEDWVNLYKNSRMGENIFCHKRLASQQNLAVAINMSDCGIFPSRAEGWNLPLLETMACGKSVITTNYSAHTEFCTHDNSLLIEQEELELAHDGIWFNGQGEWMSFTENNMDQLIEHMRNIHKLKQNGNLKPNFAGVETAKHFSWENTTLKVLEALNA